jgi:hypothetical protein
MHSFGLFFRIFGKNDHIIFREIEDSEVRKRRRKEVKKLKKEVVLVAVLALLVAGVTTLCVRAEPAKKIPVTLPG